MRPPVDDSATATVSPLSFRRDPAELARVWRGLGMFGDSEKIDESKACDGGDSLDA